MTTFVHLFITNVIQKVHHRDIKDHTTLNRQVAAHASYVPNVFWEKTKKTKNMANVNAGGTLP